MPRNLKAFLIMAAVAFTVFANGLHNAFLLDDHAFFNGRTVAETQYYPPLARLVPRLSYWLFRDNTTGHHAFNLVLWVLACWMVFILIEALFKDRLLALIAAYLYMLHPINGVMVNYITADVFSVQVIGMAGALLFLLRERPVISAGLFIISCLCHESAMVLPFLATAMLAAGQGQTLERSLRKTQWLWLAFILYFFWRLKFAGLAGGFTEKFFSYHMSVIEYLATIGQLMSWYVCKLFWPVGIVLIKAQPVVRNGIEVAVGLGELAILVAAWVGLERRYRDQPMVATGLWWLALGFLPLGFVTLFSPVLGMMIRPYWFVFPVIGFFMWGVCVLRSCFKLAEFKPVIFALGIGLGIGSMVMNTFWDGDINYCRWWVSHDAGFAAPDFYLATAYERNKNWEEARHWYKETLAWNQYRPSVIYADLGYIDLMQNRLVEAGDDLERATGQDPDLQAKVTADLGTLAFLEKDYSKARDYFVKAIAMDPFDVLSRLNLGEADLKLGQTDQAIDALAGALSVDPDNQEVLRQLTMLGLAAQKNGDLQTAAKVDQILKKFKI